MKKSLLVILPLAALALAGCRGGKGKTSNPSGESESSQSSGGETTSNKSSASNPSTPSASSEPPHPASPWPAVPDGDGTEANPWSVTQAWEYVDKNLELTYSTDASEQSSKKSSKQYYVKGYVCYLETLSDGRDPNHPHSVKFHMGDSVHHVTEEEIMENSSWERQGLCVYFADTEPAFATEEDAKAIDGCLVTVKGYLLNWGFEPEITSNGVITEIGPHA